MFELEQFIENCKEAIKESDSHMAIHALVERTVSDPAALMCTIGEPERGGVHRLYVSD